MKRKKPSDQHAAILRDLNGALAQLDEKGLLFLLEQAQTLLYNANVDRINAKAERGGGWGRPSEPEAEAAQAESAVARAAGAARADRSADPRALARIEKGEDGKVFILSIAGTRNVLSTAEVQRLVRICYGAQSKSEALRQLFALLKRERNGILFDARIASAESPLLELLFREIRAKFHLQDR